MDISASPLDLMAIQNALYSDISGYSISADGRAKAGKGGDSCFTYGEVSPEAMQLVIEGAAPAKREVFYDLGSGTGKGVIFAALLGFRRATGVELLQELWQAAETVRQRFEAAAPGWLTAAPIPQVEFRNADMCVQDFSDADLVFTHCTCFDESLMAKLATALQSLRPGTPVVTVSKSLTPAEGFEAAGSQPAAMAWGNATVYFQRRI